MSIVGEPNIIIKFNEGLITNMIHLNWEEMTNNLKSQKFTGLQTKKNKQIVGYIVQL